MTKLFAESKNSDCERNGKEAGRQKRRKLVKKGKAHENTILKTKADMPAIVISSANALPAPQLSRDSITVNFR